MATLIAPRIQLSLFLCHWLSDRPPRDLGQLAHIYQISHSRDRRDTVRTAGIGTINESIIMAPSSLTMNPALVEQFS